MQSNMNFREDRVNAFVSDVTHEDLCDNVDPFSADVVTLVRLSREFSPFYVRWWRQANIACMKYLTFSSGFYVVCGISYEDAPNFAEHQRSDKGKSFIWYWLEILSLFLSFLLDLILQSWIVYGFIWLQPNGYVLLWDYAVGDFAQVSVLVHTYHPALPFVYYVY